MKLPFSLPMPSTLQIVAIAAVASFLAGWQVHGWKTNSDRLESLDTALQDAKELRGKVDTLGQELAAAQAAQKPKDRIITKEVIRYESIVPADRRCELDGAWRMLHDSAASADPSIATSAFTTPAQPVTDAAALETIADNYETCRQWRADLIGWQRFWKEISEGE